MSQKLSHRLLTAVGDKVKQYLERRGKA